MKVYILRNTDSFLTFANDKFLSRYRNQFIGKPLMERWKEVHIPLVDDGPDSKNYDFCELITTPVFSEKAVKVLGNSLDGKAEILPYEHPTEKFYAINVIELLDCLDLSKAVVVMDLKYNIITKVKKYAFIEELVTYETIFKLPQFIGHPIFVTDLFRNKVIDGGLMGFEFIEVWDSNATDEQVLKIPIYQGSSYNYKEADALVEQGKTLASDKWVLQKQDGDYYVGELMPDGNYFWLIPIYIVPIFLDMRWYVIERKEIAPRKPKV
ncbi:hypothetical protein D3C73_962380 [compost metagenome]